MLTSNAGNPKPLALQCRHFCNGFDLHNFCPDCRGAGKQDEPCVMARTVIILFVHHSLNNGENK